MVSINVIVQYFKAKNYNRQLEIDLVLKHNCNNKYINKIYLLTETDSIDLNYLEKNEKDKIEIYNIGKRLTYLDAFDFYNDYIPNTI